jgi:molybdenum cofactor biosynthesis protein B
MHRAAGCDVLNIAVLTVSDTRSIETDMSGALIIAMAEEAGHRIVSRDIVRDEPELMTALIQSLHARDHVHAVLITGGTGISSRDQTFETVSALLTKPMPGYGELFRMLSFAEIGSACLLSRAIGGLMGKLVILVMPGSRAAVELAMRRIILPELPHIVHEARKQQIVNSPPISGVTDK